MRNHRLLVLIATYALFLTGCGGGGGSMSVLATRPRTEMVGSWTGKFADTFANPSRHGSYQLIVYPDYSFTGMNTDGGFRTDVTGQIEANGDISTSLATFPSGNQSPGKPNRGHLTLLASGHLQGTLIFTAGDVTIDLTRTP